MCGRYSLTAAPPRVEAFLEASGGGLLRARFNVAPGQEACVAVRNASGRRVLVAQAFGLETPLAGGHAAGTRNPNARAERAAEAPTFRDAFRRRRCLVPADGFYEWRRGRHGAEPHHVALPDRALFALAAIFEPAEESAGAPRASFAILTGPAPRPLRALHPRAPILVDPRQFDAWLDPALAEPAEIRALLGGELGEGLSFRPVDPRVNDARFEDPACLEPAPQLPLL